MTEEEVVETEIIAVVDEPLDVVVVDVSDDRNFFNTPLNDYTVTEGLLLLIFVFMVIKFLLKLLKEGFSWLLP